MKKFKKENLGMLASLLLVVAPVVAAKISCPLVFGEPALPKHLKKYDK